MGEGGGGGEKRDMEGERQRRIDRQTDRQIDRQTEKQREREHGGDRVVVVVCVWGAGGGRGGAAKGAHHKQISFLSFSVSTLGTDSETGETTTTIPSPESGGRVLTRVEALPLLSNEGSSDTQPKTGMLK